MAIRPALWSQACGTPTAARSPEAGAAWSTPQRLDDATGTTAQLSPTVAFTATETMLGWRDNRLNANGDTQARRVVFLPGLTDHFALTYDGLNRLTSVKGPVSESFTLDQASNVSVRSGTTETYDTANRLTQDGSTVITWWDADRLKTRGPDTFNYDALDRLKDSTVAGTTRTYTYNGDALMQSRIQAGTTTFLWDPSTAISRLLKQGNDNIVYGLGPLYVVRADATTLTLSRDGSKSVRAETSAAGTVAAALRYRSYGQLAQASSTGPSYIGYASQVLDPSGLYYMRARWFDPSSGRFLSRDGIAGSPGMPNSLNGYAYAFANPMTFSDPTGLIVQSFSGDSASVIAPDDSARLNPSTPIDDCYNGKGCGGANPPGGPGGPGGRVDTLSRTYQTYTKTNSATGEVYVGRTSGYGSARQNVARRDSGHEYTDRGYGPAELDESSGSYAAIRGREQQLIDYYRAQGISADQINGVGPRNIDRDLFFRSAGDAFGGVP